MRKSYLLLIFMLITISVSGQNWFPTTASWYYNQVILFSGNTYQHLSVVGDTTLHGKNCRIIKGVCECSYYGDENILYEEGDRIFLYSAPADSFKLLYDFSLQPGDTLVYRGDLEVEGDGSFLIDSITPMNVGPLGLRVQHITRLDGYLQYGTRIIERIGANGCLYPVIWVCDPGTAGLRCYEDDVIGLQRFIQPELACDYTTAVEDPGQRSKVKVYPNPVQDRLNIEATEAILTVEFVHMPSGKVFKSTGFNQTEFDIDVSSLSSGAYILKLYADTGGVQIVKVILME